jgi:prophage tail gpP-like protein
MPTPINELVEVTAEGSRYTNWTSVVYRWGMDDNWIVHITLVCAEPSAADIKLKPKDKVSVKFGGQPALQDGMVKTRQARLDGDAHIVQIDCVCKAHQVMSASVNTDKVQYQNYKFDAVANAILKPIGVKFKMEKSPKGADEPFRNLILYRGENMFNALTRLAAQRNIYLSSDPEGNVVGGDPKGGSSFTLEEGRNIYVINSYIDDPSVEGIVGQSQQQGSDEVSGRRASEISAKAKVGDGGSGSGAMRVLLAEEPLNQKELQARVDRTARDLEAATWRTWVTHQGWFKPGTQELWHLRDKVSIRSPTVFPKGYEVQQGYVWNIVAKQDQSGTQTTVEFVNEKVFAQVGGSDSPVFGSANTQPSTPEAPPP